MGSSVKPSCGLLLTTLLQAGLLIALFSITSNSNTDTYFMYKTQLTANVLLELNSIANETHPMGWIGPTFEVNTNFMVLPVTTCVGIVLMIGLFMQSWTYRMSTSSDMTMESYSPEVLSEHAQWDAMFIAYVICEHALIITMLCNPLSFSFMLVQTLLISIAIVERCAPRSENVGRNDTSQSLSTLSLAAAAFVGFQVLSAIKRHLHSSGIFFIVHVLLDMMLILGHTWDARNHQFATAMNCRAFFVVSSSCLLFVIFVTHCSHVAGRDVVSGAVSGIYGNNLD
jgi:hypothetical protein